MPIEIGDRMPDGRFHCFLAGAVREISAPQLFAGKRVVLFAVPGAFTPVCSDAHLPGFLARHEDLRGRGVDVVACLAVNDAYVLDAWARERGVGKRVLMLADGSGDYARALGLEIDLSRAGLGRRVRRFAAVIEDGVVRVLRVEPGPGVSVSGAEHIVAALGASPRASERDAGVP